MAKPIHMMYFTDPYCAWSWALQPTLEELVAVEGEGLEVRYHQLPLIEDLAKSGLSGEDVAEKWEHVSRLTGAKIDAGLWREHPPKSTLAACRASKAAGAIGPRAEGRFLHALRAMLMTLKRSAEDLETLAIAARKAEIDEEAFKRELKAEDLDERLQEDRDLAKQHGVTQTPAVVLTNAHGDKIVIQGPRDLALFRRAIQVLRVEDATAEAEAPGKVTATPLMPESKEARQQG